MNFQSLTFKAPGIARSIVIPVIVCQSERLCKKFNKEKIDADVLALIDTGATNSSVSDKLAVSIGLKEIEQCRVDAAGGSHISNVFSIDIFLRNMVSFTNIRSTEFVDNGMFDIIIGMDIITQGDLAITNYNQRTVVSFRVPPDNKHIDFSIT